MEEEREEERKKEGTALSKDHGRTVVFLPNDQLVWVVAVVESIDEESGSYNVEIIDPEYKKMDTKSGSASNSTSDTSVKTTVHPKDLPYPHVSFPFHNTHMPKEGVNDMCELNYLHEPSILDNLHRRFQVDMPYTYTGNICIAINPYQWLPLYTDSLQELHIEHFRHELPPHVYAASSSAYR